MYNVKHIIYFKNIISIYLKHYYNGQFSTKILIHIDHSINTWGLILNETIVTTYNCLYNLSKLETIILLIIKWRYYNLNYLYITKVRQTVYFLNK